MGIKKNGFISVVMKPYSLHLQNLFFISLIKLLNAAGRINKYFFARIKGVRSRAHLDFYQRIGLAVFPFDGFLGTHSRPGQEFVIALSIMKYNFLIFRMYVLFHFRNKFRATKIIPCS